jgi:hypothetical protein
LRNTTSGYTGILVVRTDPYLSNFTQPTPAFMITEIKAAMTNLKTNWAGVITILLILSYADIFTYFIWFDIAIYPFVDATELLFGIAGTLALTVPVLFFVGFLTITFEDNSFKIAKGSIWWYTIRTLAVVGSSLCILEIVAGSVSRSWPEGIIMLLWLLVVLSIIWWINREFDKKVETVVVALDSEIENKKQEAEKADLKKRKPEKIAAYEKMVLPFRLLLFFFALILMMLYLNGLKARNNKIAPKYGIELTRSIAPTKTDSSFHFMGNTKNYLFFLKNDSTVVIPRSDVKQLKQKKNRAGI